MRVVCGRRQRFVYLRTDVRISQHNQWTYEAAMGETPHVTLPEFVRSEQTLLFLFLKEALLRLHRYQSPPLLGTVVFVSTVSQRRAFLPQPRLSDIPILFLLDQFLDNSG